MGHGAFGCINELGDVVGIEGRGDAALGYAVDAGEEVFDDVFKLALAFNDVAHALEAVALLCALEEDDGVALGNMVETETFRSFGLDADAVDGDVEEVGDTGTHFSGDGCNFWRGKNERSVDVDDAVAGVAYLFEGEIEKDGGVGIFPAWVAGRKEAAYVARGDGAEKRVSDGVEENVAIGVASEALGVVQREAADAQRNTWFECVRVPAKSNACAHLWFDPLIQLGNSIVACVAQCLAE